MREIQQRIRQYELMAVFSPDVTEDDLPAAIERVGGYVTTAGGEIVSVNHESPWGRRRLAYAIRYQGRDVRDGYYVLYYFDIQSTQVAEIEHEIGLNDKLIRHIITIRGEIPAVAEPEEGAEAAADGSPAPVAATGAAPGATAVAATEVMEAPEVADETPADAVEAAPVEAAPVETAAPEEAAAPDVVKDEEAVPAEVAAGVEPTES